MQTSYKLLGSSVIVCIALAVGMYWQHSIISSQRSTIDSMTVQIEGLEKQAKARDKVAKQNKLDKAQAEKERDEFKRKLKDAEKDSPCANAPLSDESKRVLKDLYNSQSSF